MLMGVFFFPLMVERRKNMNKKTKKSPADISIEKANEILQKLGLPPSKTVNGKGAIIYFPKKDDSLLNYLKNKSKEKCGNN